MYLFSAISVNHHEFFWEFYLAHRAYCGQPQGNYLIMRNVCINVLENPRFLNREF
jgi:hypothetical protein